MKIGIGNILEHLQMLSTKTFVVKKMVYLSQRLDAKPVESCVSVRRRADPRCFLRRINCCRAAAEGEEGGVEEGRGAERELSPVPPPPPLLFRISQSVSLPARPALARSLGLSMRHISHVSLPHFGATVGARS